MEKKILLDTNILLSTPEILDTNPQKYVISLTTLRELDKLKRNPDLNYAVRHAIKSIKRNFKQIEIDINEILDPDDLTNDEKIIKVAQDKGHIFKTEDIGAFVLAMLYDVEVLEDVEDDGVYDPSYTGYIEEHIDDEALWNILYHSITPNVELLEEFGKNLMLNQYLILFNFAKQEEYIILYKNGDGEIIKVPVEKYKKAIKSIGIKIEPLDAYQWIVIESILNDTKIVIIDGKLGTGKTLLSVVGALLQVKSHDNFFKKFDKISLIRPPETINSKYKSGYLPGELNEKLSPWLIGFKSNLEFLFETNQVEKDEKKSEVIFDKYFKILSLEHIQGASLHNEIVLLDEYELLDRDMSHQTLSRIESSSKMILIGDPDGQSYNKNRGSEGYKVLRKHLKDKKILSYIKLDKIYRGELAEFVEEIFKN